MTWYSFTAWKTNRYPAEFTIKRIQKNKAEELYNTFKASGKWAIVQIRINEIWRGGESSTPFKTWENGKPVRVTE